MWNKDGEQLALCVEYREALEDLRPGIDEAEGRAELEKSLSAEVLQHVLSCEACKEASRVFWESRSLLSASGLVRPGYAGATAHEMPWLATRVMAKIAERETAERVSGAEWSGAVTRLASRLAWVSAIALAIAATLVYEPQPRHEQGTMVSQAAGEAPQYLFDNGSATTNADDALASPVER